MLYLCIVLLCIFVVIEYAYICRLKKAIQYAIRILKKYEAAFVMDKLFQEEDFMKGTSNGFKKD